MQSTCIVDGQSATDWIFVHVAAQRIERSPRSVRRYAHQGLLTYKREGRRALLVLREDVERLARRRRF
jgi:hypothetical protein